MTPSNVLLRIASLDTGSIKDIYERFKESTEDEVLNIDGTSTTGNSAPHSLVEPAPPLDAEFLIGDALLVNYGQAFPINQPPQREAIGIPYHYAAPEFILDGKVGVKSEIWSLGCVIYEIRAGQQLFEDWLGNEDDALSQIVQMLGKMPDPWWHAWVKRSSYLKEGISIEDEDEAWPLERQITDIGHEGPRDGLGKELGTFFEVPGTRVPAEEVALFKDLLEGIFKWKPEERTSISDILKHPWFGFPVSPNIEPCA